MPHAHAFPSVWLMVHRYPFSSAQPMLYLLYSVFPQSAPWPLGHSPSFRGANKKMNTRKVRAHTGLGRTRTGDYTPHSGAALPTALQGHIRPGADESPGQCEEEAPYRTRTGTAAACGAPARGICPGGGMAHRRERRKKREKSK